MATVYLIAQPTKKRVHPKAPREAGRVLNLEPLNVYGRIVFLLEEDDYPTFDPVGCFHLIKQRLHGFDPKVDYVAWAGGDTLGAVMAGIIFAHLGIRSIKWLRYERPKDPVTGLRTDNGARYVPVLITVDSPNDPRQLDLLTSYEGDLPDAGGPVPGRAGGSGPSTK